MPGKGRGLVATRKLSPGFTVLREAPVLVVSKLRPNLEKLLMDFLKHNKETQLDILKLHDSVDKPEDLTIQANLIAKLMRIVDVNSIVSYQADMLPTKNVFLTASLLNHDCRPNLAWYPAGGKIVVNVLRSVEKGEELTVSYYAESVGTYQRGGGCLTLRQRREKLVKYMFDCQCNICQQDTSEDDVMREEYQKIDRMLDDDLGVGLGKLVEHAERKLELARELDDQVVFMALIDCWKLSQFLATKCQDSAVADQAKAFKDEAAMYARILGPCAVQAFFKFDGLSLEEMESESKLGL